MAVSINSNISALGSIRRLADSSDTLTRSFERLSSGQRINRASDDPAGLAVALTLGVKSRVLNRAYLNAADGVSALDIADGALGEVSRIYERMAELAEQSANGTLSAQQRINLNREYGQLDKEVRRLADSVTFNGLQLLSGTKVANRLHDTGISNDIGVFGFHGTSADGRYAVIRSSDISGELFFYDHLSGTKTSIATGNSNAFNASMSQNGDFVYSDTATDQVYLRKLNGEVIQLTNSLSSAENFAGLSMSGDGRFVAFTSRTIYTDGGTVNDATGTGNERIYRLDLETGQIRAMATDVGTVTNLQLSNDGSKLAFRTSTNILSQGDGGIEFYAIDFSQASLSITQLTNGTGSSGNTALAISDDGAVYFFDARNLNGLNAAAVEQVFKYQMSDGSLTTLSSNTTSSSYAALRLTADGSTLLFTAQNNATGENPNSYTQAFRLDFSTGTLRQLTRYTSNTSAFSLGANTGIFSGDGNRIYTRWVGQLSLYTVDLAAGSSTIDLEVGHGSGGNISTALRGLRGLLSGLAAYTLTSSSSSKAALDNARSNIAALASLRGQIGASSSRLSIASALLLDQRLESEAARGRVRDIDVATESAAVARSQILQQVGASIVAQANIQPRIALSLLRDV